MFLVRILNHVYCMAGDGGWPLKYSRTTAQCSVWHEEVLAKKSKRLPFLTSRYRRSRFTEHMSHWPPISCLQFLSYLLKPTVAKVSTAKLIRRRNRPLYVCLITLTFMSVAKVGQNKDTTSIWFAVNVVRCPDSRFHCHCVPPPCHH